MCQALGIFIEMKQDSFIEIHKQYKRNVGERTKKEGGYVIVILNLQSGNWGLEKLATGSRFMSLKLI